MFKRLRRSARPVPLALLLAVAVFTVLAGSLLAASYLIDLNDGSIAEWSGQGIPLFALDPQGDTPLTTDDVVNASVASADIKQTSGNIPGLTFLAQTAMPPALSQPGRAIAAMLDCDRNGLDNERQDRWVVYNTTGPRTDEVTLYTGDQYFGLVPTAALPKFLGQRVLNNLEWGIPISELPIRGDEPPELGTVVDCKHKVNIRIATMQFVTPTGFIVLDTLLPPLGWDISTGKPLSATLTISRPEFEPENVELQWNMTGQSEAYSVLRSADTPYGDLPPFDITSNLTYTDVGAATSPAGAYFYQVRGTTGGIPTVDPSNTVGVFRFELVPGEPPA